MSKGKFVWYDLMSTDVAASVAFHKALFGWEVEEMDMSGFKYSKIVASGKGSGGVVPFDASHGFPSHWVGYIEVFDVDGAVGRVEALGGKGCVPPTDIPETGRFALVEDPQGAIFSPFAASFDYPEEGEPEVGQFCWSELMTTDVDGARAFYGELLGWTTAPVDMGPMGTYHLVGGAEKHHAGIMGKPEGFGGDRPSWLFYIRVADTDAIVARVADLGGEVLMPPMDIPNTGRSAIIADPTGAPLALIALFRQGE